MTETANSASRSIGEEVGNDGGHMYTAKYWFIPLQDRRDIRLDCPGNRQHPPRF